MIHTCKKLKWIGTITHQVDMNSACELNVLASWINEYDPAKNKHKYSLLNNYPS